MKSKLLLPKRGLTASIGLSAFATPFDLASAGLDNVSDATMIMSFHRLAGPEPEYMRYDACTRITVPDGVTHVIVVGTQSAAAYADLVLWDIAHGLPVGGLLTVIEPVEFDDVILGRAYFEGVFEQRSIGHQGWSQTEFRKVKLTRSEEEAGLDGWTFGVPVGEAAPAVVIKLTRDITRLGLDSWELVLAVSRETNHDKELPPKVRLIVCSGATITEKKNRIAQAAEFTNLCVFHDRIELPRNFKSAITRFGDHYGLCGFQQFLSDPARDSLERYSDYHLDLGDGRLLIDVDGPQGSASLYVQSLETRLRYRARFAEAHPAEFDRRSYLTGALYLSKRSTWRMIRQNPEIEWNELEDVEFGERAMSEFGVPSRLNPYAFGFTSRVRAVLVGAHEVVDRRSSGSIVKVTSNYREGAVSNKATGLSQLVVRQRAWQLFKEFGLPDYDLDMRSRIFCDSLNTQRQYSEYWIRLLYRLAIPRRAGRVRQFLEMFSNAAFGFTYDAATLDALTTSICGGAFFIDTIIRDNYFIRSLANMPNLINRSAETPDQILFEQAMRLWRRGGDYVYPYDTFDELWSVMKESV